MNIATDSDGRFDWGGISLFREDSSCLFSDKFDLFLGDTFEISKVVYDHIYFIFIAHLNNNNTMISDK
jgi:hypothetical protein